MYQEKHSLQEICKEVFGGNFLPEQTSTIILGLVELKCIAQLVPQVCSLYGLEVLILTSMTLGIWSRITDSGSSLPYQNGPGYPRLGGSCTIGIHNGLWYFGFHDNAKFGSWAIGSVFGVNKIEKVQVSIRYSVKVVHLLRPAILELFPGMIDTGQSFITGNLGL